jgi:hypothetical protein
MLELDAPALLAPGALSITSITLDGVALDLADVLADVTIRHGRAGYFDEASPATCTLELLGVDRAFTRPFRLGSLLVVNATDGSTIAPRFTGRLTDATLDLDTLSATAVGRLRELPGYTVGTVDYPEEAWSSRVTRAFREAGLAGTNLVLNPDLEASTAGWVGWSPGTTQPVLGRSNEPQHVKSGGYALFMTLQNTDATPQFAMVWGNDPAPIPCTAGQRFRVRVYASGLYGLAIGVRDNGGGFAGPDNRPDLWEAIEGLHFTGYNGVQLGGIYTVPPGTTSIQLGVGIAVPAGTTYYAAADLWELFPLEEDVLVLQAGAAFDPVLVARPAEPVALDTYLGELATTVESAVADLPDGRILVQAIAARTLAGLYALDPAEVAYAPTWEQRLPDSNIVTVGYGDPAAPAPASLTVRDDASVDLYGPIDVAIATTIKSATDAATMGGNRLARNAYAHWTVAGAPLLVGRRLSIGQALELDELPPAAPFDPWTPILEGWTDSIVSDGQELDWTMALDLSDPLRSGLALPWNAVPAGDLWNTINAALQWRDALTLSDL